ncbi:MAG: HAD family hydrolase [Chloroflexota bacterium]
MEERLIPLEIPGFGSLRLRHAVFDVNGTLAVDGQGAPEIGARLAALSAHAEVHLLSSLSHGNQEELERSLGFAIHRVQPGNEAEQKADYIRQLGAERCVAVGNGRNDVLMLKEAALAIVVLNPEGVAASALGAADIVVPSPLEAVDLLLNPRRILATLRS